MKPEQLKKKFRQKGKTFSAWAKAHGYTPREVYLVRNGFSKCKHGKGHEIAVALGLKEKA